jgi:hypothetical protein
MIPKDIERWSKADWERNVYYCLPSGGGAVGVVFVWTKRANFNDPRTSDFVIKPIQGTAGPTKFAEMMLKKVAHANSPNSRAVTKMSPVGIAMLQSLKGYRDRETNPKTLGRWKEVWLNYYNAQTFLIQELQTGMSDLGDEYRKEGGLAKFLSNEVLMTNLGRLFAADALIGNGDRLYSVNTGNILFKSDGTFCAIDSSTILTAFNSVLKDSESEFQDAVKKLQFEPGVSAEEKHAAQVRGARDHYVAAFVHRGALTLPSPLQKKQIAQNKPVALPVAFGIREIFDPKGWWDGIFVPHFQKGGIDVVSMATTFNAAFEQFKRGFDAGVRDIDRRLSGLNWLMLKAEYRKISRKYGLDPNLNLDNLKIRRRYFKELKKGSTAKQALSAVQAYAKSEMPGM